MKAIVIIKAKHNVQMMTMIEKIRREPLQTTKAHIVFASFAIVIDKDGKLVRRLIVRKRIMSPSTFGRVRKLITTLAEGFPAIR